MQKQILATNVQNFIGQKIKVKVIGKVGFDPYFGFFHEELTYDNATLLKYDSEKRELYFQTKSGIQMNKNPLEVWSY
ncbi:hypothetical protein [Leptospira kirschneri]|uniref:hypothetical protein n=1 Tax=Leptospira kirschneri TaxID=29507 RepID=UPI0002928FA1|nr:hypothetical protein [Leptospira kirschneri]EKO62280.1 hypothetical protein LEP1GSC082_4592 [Leptospira kirschneri str. H2]